MKKFFMVALMAVITLSASAQLITSNRTVRSRNHNTWIDLGVGGYTNSGAKGTDLNLGLRFNKMYTEYLGWDILKVAARSNTEDLGEDLSVEAMTGMRGESPVLFGNAKAYAHFDLGYLYAFDLEEGAFTWELGAGLKLTPRFNIGIVYNSYKFDGAKDAAGIIGLRLGFAL